MYLSLLVTLLAIPFGMATPVGPTELTERANGYKFSGKATYYTPGLGVCGHTNTAKEHVVAMNNVQYTSADCNKDVTIYNPATKRTAKAKVVDRCAACEKDNLDLSTSLFKYLSKGDLGEGTFQMDWKFD